MIPVNAPEPTYTLTLTETQLQALAHATELHARLGAGQIDAAEAALPDHVLGQDVDTYALRDALSVIKRDILHLPGMNLGSSHPDAAPLADVNWDLYQVARHALWAARDARGEAPLRNNASTPPFLPACKTQPFAPITRHDPGADTALHPHGTVTLDEDHLRVNTLSAPLDAAAHQALLGTLRAWLNTRAADTEAARAPGPRGGVYYPDLPFRPALIQAAARASIELTPDSGQQTLLPAQLLRVVVFDGRDTTDAVLDVGAVRALLE